jgi:hypothetical protein
MQTLELSRNTLYDAFSWMFDHNELLAPIDGSTRHAQQTKLSSQQQKMSSYDAYTITAMRLVDLRENCRGINQC